MSRPKIRNIKPLAPTPKFQPGQRVRISRVGVEFKVAPPGTMGTVESCGWMVVVLIDGAEDSHTYAPDFWEAPLLTQ